MVTSPGDGAEADRLEVIASADRAADHAEATEAGIPHQLMTVSVSFDFLVTVSRLLTMNQLF
jgi:hypothetical protein